MIISHDGHNYIKGVVDSQPERDNRNRHCSKYTSHFFLPFCRPKNIEKSKRTSLKCPVCVLARCR